MGLTGVGSVCFSGDLVSMPLTFTFESDRLILPNSLSLSSGPWTSLVIVLRLVGVWSEEKEGDVAMLDCDGTWRSS